MSARVAGALVLGSTLAGLYFASQTYFNPALHGLITWQRALSVNLTYYYLLGAAAPLVFVLTRRFPLHAGRRRRAVVVHGLASLAVSAAIIVAAEVILAGLFGGRSRPSATGVWSFAVGANLHTVLASYGVLLLGAVAADAYVRLRDQEVREAQLETRLAGARLQALRMQLQPHFLFNTLNSISSLMYADVERADTMLARLGDFLRLTLAGDSRQVVPLREELAFVRAYLEIERVRFADRLRVVEDIDERLLDAPVPTLVLQPIVENAIHHAIARCAGEGRLAVAARREQGALVLSVSDNGPGLPPGGPPRTRVGLGATRDRLAQMYGDRHLLRLAGSPDGGLQVEIRLPLEGA